MSTTIVEPKTSTAQGFQFDPEFVPDFKAIKARYRAWWNNSMEDRPVVYLATKREKPRWPLHKLPDISEEPHRAFFDLEYQIKAVENMLANTEFFGDSIPIFPLGVGTGYLGLFTGAQPKFNDQTVWLEPFVENWEKTPRPHFNPGHPVFQKIVESAKHLAKHAKGRYMLAVPDQLDAATTMSQIRGVENLMLDLMDTPEPVLDYQKTLVEVWKASADFWKKFDKDLGYPGSINWAEAFSDKFGGVVQCDFSAMIGPDMFKWFVKPELEAEATYLGETVYHWDGPGQLVHFEDLIDIPQIKALQWVPGTGARPSGQWPELLQKVQAAGKSLQIYAHAKEIDTYTQILKPEGVMLIFGFGGIENLSYAECKSIIKKVECWGAHGVL